MLATACGASYPERVSAPFATAPPAPAAGPPGQPVPPAFPGRSGPLVATGPRPPVRQPRRRTAPQVLRLWAAALVIGCAALLTMTIVGFARLTSQVDTIGAEAAPQAATASDIYFALSDLDAQAATLIMLGDAQSLSLNRLSALATFEQRTAEVDADLAQANRGATDAAQRARLGRIADELTLYRQWIWQAIDAQQRSVTVAPVDAVPPPSASLGLYAQATTVLRTALLPDV